jgi:hypothetical protein
MEESFRSFRANLIRPRWIMVMLPFKRKKLFVNRGIQGAMALRFGLYWVMYHICLWNGAFMYFFLRARLSQLTGSDEPMLSLSDMYSLFLKEYIPITAAATLLLPIVIYELIRQTHRIAGPLVRFSHAMRDMMAGKTIPPVKLREGDMLTEFETLFNEFVAFHQSKVQTLARIEAQTLENIEVPGLDSVEEPQLVASNADR